MMGDPKDAINEDIRRLASRNTFVVKNSQLASPNQADQLIRDEAPRASGGSADGGEGISTESVNPRSRRSDMNQWIRDEVGARRSAPR